jgi:phage-related holin
MSTAQIVQLLITLFGIALAVVVFLFGPYDMLVNGIIAFVIFVLAGMAAALAYAKLSNKG